MYELLKLSIHNISLCQGGSVERRGLKEMSKKMQTMDAELACLQAFVLDTVGPLLQLLEKLKSGEDSALLVEEVQQDVEAAFAS